MGDWYKMGALSLIQKITKVISKVSLSVCWPIQSWHPPVDSVERNQIKARNKEQIKLKIRVTKQKCQPHPSPAILVRPSPNVSKISNTFVFNLSIWLFWVSISLPISLAMAFKFPRIFPTDCMFSSISSSRASLLILWMYGPSDWTLTAEAPEGFEPVLVGDLPLLLPLALLQDASVSWTLDCLLKR